ncbi:hypothetical protein [Candidatus Uabimicrobium amorphum]|uniref:Uncharacterized protein n=1 Tax=Uabimicrobium amorphum TaxID=2596890 RepID=A0A5S9F6J6_UABAM|nr:hypothetical protein [Candidatus Uabimicrobium amorphum]BBM86674.1 hypothetical protein UABAM_05060 [Candidatus Uabimicrobium amorphum]
MKKFENSFSEQDLAIAGQRQDFLYCCLVLFFKRTVILAVGLFCLTVLVLYSRYHGVISDQDGIKKISQHAEVVKKALEESDAKIQEKRKSLKKAKKATPQVPGDIKKAQDELDAALKADNLIKDIKDIETTGDSLFTQENLTTSTVKKYSEKIMNIDNDVRDRLQSTLETLEQPELDATQLEEHLKKVSLVKNAQKSFEKMQKIASVIPLETSRSFKQEKYYFSFMVSLQEAYNEWRPQTALTAIFSSILLLIIWVFMIAAILFIPFFIFFVDKSFKRFPSGEFKGFRRFQFYAAVILPFVIFAFIIAWRAHDIDPEMLSFLQNTSLLTLVTSAVVISCCIWAINELIPVTFRFSLFSVMLYSSLLLLFVGNPVALYVMIFGILLYSIFGMEQFEKVVHGLVTYDMDPVEEAGAAASAEPAESAA